MLAADRPQTASGLSNCTSPELVPALREVTVNQGVGSYARRVRGKETLVKFFLSNPTTCTVTSTQSLKVTAATLAVNNTVQTFRGSRRSSRRAPAAQRFRTTRQLTRFCGAAPPRACDSRHSRSLRRSRP
jgi:hypothetical protein